MTSYLNENEAENLQNGDVILLKFLTLKWNVSRTVRCIEVSEGSFFFIFHAPSFEVNCFFDRSFPLILFGSAGARRISISKEKHRTTLGHLFIVKTGQLTLDDNTQVFDFKSRICNTLHCRKVTENRLQWRCYTYYWLHWMYSLVI